MSDDILNIFDDKKYARLAIANNKKYLKNKPFPHIYFNNFLPEKIALMLFKEYPKIKSANKNWKIHKNSNVDRYFLEDSSKFKKKFKIIFNGNQFKKIYFIFRNFNWNSFNYSGSIFYGRRCNDFSQKRFFKSSC